MSPLIHVRISDEESVDQLSGPRLSKLLDDEMNRFEAWMTKSLGGGLSKFERAAVKTYLYQKIVGRVDQLEAQPMNPLELVSKTG